MQEHAGRLCIVAEMVPPRWARKDNGNRHEGALIICLRCTNWGNTLEKSSSPDSGGYVLPVSQVWLRRVGVILKIVRVPRRVCTGAHKTQILSSDS